MRTCFHDNKLSLWHRFQFVHCEKRSADHLERLRLILAMGHTARQNCLLSQRFGQHFRTLTIWRKTAEYLDELEFLAETAGAVTVRRFTQRLDGPSSITYVGKGKLEEIRRFIDCLLYTSPSPRDTR